MAEIHELIDQVADPGLKAQLLAAVNKVTAPKKASKKPTYIRLYFVGIFLYFHTFCQNIKQW